jgi:hypothetical protein
MKQVGNLEKALRSRYTCIISKDCDDQKDIESRLKFKIQVENFHLRASVKDVEDIKSSSPELVIDSTLVEKNMVLLEKMVAAKQRC